MIYTVDKIEEDLDYGCEERDENQPVVAVVTLVSLDGGSQKCKMPDHLLYERNISSGDSVIFDEDHFLCKPLSRNWTQECSGSCTNLADFSAWMQDAREGKPIRKICPFCGGKVGYDGAYLAGEGVWWCAVSPAGEIPTG